jgi:hypothetical protein
MLKNVTSRSAFAVAAVCLLLPLAWGDSLELKNGSLIKGKYLGGTETEVSFQVGSAIQRYPISDISAITFDSAARAVKPAASPELTPRMSPAQPARAIAPVRAPRTVTVPGGTRILVRTIDPVDSDRNQVGDKFRASLEQPLMVGDIVVAPKGADVYGHLTQAKEAGHIQGRSELKLELTGIVINGQTIPLTTGEYSVSGSSRGASTAKRVGGGAALGALIGGIAGGGKGAAIGAGVGGGAGTAVQVMTKGEQVHVPSETLLEFALQQDVTVPVATPSE